MDEEVEGTISVGGEPTISDEEILGFDPAKEPKAQADGRKASDVPVVPEKEPQEAADTAADEVEEPVSAEKAVAEEGSLAAAAPTGEKFSFYGREFDSREAAEQFFRTWEGQVSAAQRRLEEMTSNLERQNRRIEELSAPKAPEKAAEPKPLPKRFADTIDWSVYNAIAEDKGQALAQEWLALKLDDYQEARETALQEALVEKFESRFKGWDQMSGYMEKMQLAGGLFQDLAARVDDQGKPAYPEINSDPQFLEEMAQHWDRIPEKEKMGVHGAYLAYLETRDRRSRLAPKPAAPPKPAPKPLNPAKDNTLSGGASSRVSTQAPRARDSVSAAIEAELKRVDPVLGF